MANFDAMKILGGLLSSGALSRGSGSNVLGSVIGALTGNQAAAGQAAGGGLGSLVGGMLGGGTSAGGRGGVGDLLGGLLGGGAQSTGGGLGELFGMALNQFGGGQSQAGGLTGSGLPTGVDPAQAERQAELMVRAMINAAKADGRVDRDEQQRIVDHLGEVSREELEFVQRELTAPLDIPGFIASVPRGSEAQVYAVSLMAIDLDSNPEARYLQKLAQGFGLSADACNQIHDQMGAPRLYR